MPNSFSSSLSWTTERLLPDRLTSRCGIFIIVIITLIACSFARAAEQSISLGWQPSPDTNVVGYFIAYGTAKGSYSSQLNVGTNTSGRVSGLSRGVTYYFIVVAYDAQSNQSPPSGEISVTIPGLLYITPGANPGSPVRLTFPTAPSHWYEIQAATIPGSWQTIWRTPVERDSETVEYADPSNRYMPMRFYRLVLH